MSQLSDHIGYRILRKRFRKVQRDKEVQNFDTASSAVILFDTSLPDCFSPVKDFAKFLKKQNIRTYVVGFVSQKEIPDEMLLWPGIEFITKKQVNWYGSPRGEVAEKLFNMQPDLLFVISMQEQLTMEYLTRLSEARFKIGCFRESDNDLDLMINPADKACEVGYFIEQVRHYIQLLNPKN